MRSLLAALNRNNYKRPRDWYRSYSHYPPRKADPRFDMVQLPTLSQVAATARSWWQAPQCQPHGQGMSQPNPRAQMSRPSGPPPPNPRRPVAFISGPLEVDQEYFSTHYLPKIRTAVRQGHHFLIGASRGTDTLSFEYLRNCRVHPSRITVYFNTWEETKLRYKFRKFEENGGAVVIVHGGYTERDEAMTRASHYDILRYRTEDELKTRYGAKYRKRISGTQKNEMRRQQGFGLTWPGTEHLGKRKEIKEDFDLVQDEAEVADEVKTETKQEETKQESKEDLKDDMTLSKGDGLDDHDFAAPPPYSEKL
ncbi:hypothetical protein CVT26_015844 [Gymnopilus dilepis]|uniref:Uncharacterized protein n=1 Tax=Gymnopilus dilepis TaxID=231916 RepID=A0A409XYA5_9AGAR|nr:hypothetical protein CVT26_015844 [Gymnopilus dilepis]